MTDQRIAKYLLIAAVCIGGFVLASALYYKTGFPLDDAWIHQTYARNIVETGKWSFQNGVLSGGSTSPLWSFLQTPGQLFGIPPVLWSGLINLLLLGYLGQTVSEGISGLVDSKPAWAFWGGALAIVEWHHVWAAGSGMETLFFTVIAARILVDLIQDHPNAIRSGLLIGVTLWVRPDGLTLFGPVLLVLLFKSENIRDRIASIAKLMFSSFLIVGPYLIFNVLLTGELWPTTMFAKQAEYASLQMQPFGSRLFDQLIIPFVGVGIVLLPWFLAGFRSFYKDRSWAVAAGLLWVTVFAGLYAWRLPVTYQHGRYLIPVIPIWIMYGFAAFLRHSNFSSKQLLIRVSSKVSLLLLAVVSLIFFGIGARAFAQDVAIIESEMVATAEWVSENTALTARIAAHDIGALGYFGGRDLIDLAGLISPEVIPIIRDETALKEFILEQSADYLITLEGWYPEIEAGMRVMYKTNAPFSLQVSGPNMVVYDINDQVED